MGNFTDVASLLNFLVYGGGVILVASWLLDKIPAFNNLPIDAKKYINIALSVALALGSYAALLYVPAGYFAIVDPWFKIALGIVVLYSGQQVVHKLTKPQ
jgi:hypothetical protein